MPRYLLEHFDRREDAYDAILNPDGYVALCLAENKLVWNLLRPKMLEFRDIPHSAICYDEMIGSDRFRTRLAGGGSVLEALFCALGDPGDGVLVPTPSYSGFWPTWRVATGWALCRCIARRTTGFA